MRHLIYTYCNAGKGDFLIEHWLKSLCLNVCLSKIDVMVIDFGLSPAQRATLLEQGVIIWPGIRDGRMSACRSLIISALAGGTSVDTATMAPKMGATPEIIENLAC